jgi:hypothetical protein
MINKANGMGALTGVPTSRRAPRISHIFFADDSLLFCRATVEQWGRLQNILLLYEKASGQKLNNNKTSMFFSKNTTVVDKEAILEIVGVPATHCYDTYLGLPALVGKSRTTAFKGILDRVWKRLQDWKLQFLSQAGKEILLKAVIQAIPSYCLSIFLLPKSLCSNITSHMRRFWWGHQENEQKINWMSWEKMGLGKASGGMGFRDLNCFNRALLAKQCWRLWKNPDSLVARLMRAKYYPDGSILEAQVGTRPSFAWWSISSSCEVLKEGLIWRIGNGAAVQIWKDKWIPNPSTFRIVTPPNILSPNATVKELFEPDLKGWNIPLLEDIFSIEEVQLIRSLPISCTNQPDTLIWRSTNNGIFSIRSTYHLQMEHRYLNSAGSSFSRGQMAFGKNYGVWRSQT